MGYGSIYYSNLNKVSFGLFYPLSYCFGNFFGLSQAVSYATVAITNHNNSAKTETATAFNNLCYSVDMDDPVFQSLFIYICCGQPLTS
jgi:hypothetical protein